MFGYLWKISSFVCLFFLLCNLLYVSVFAVEGSSTVSSTSIFKESKSYAKCSERGVVESFASSDYIKKMGIDASSSLGFENVEKANEAYINFIGLPEDGYSNYLFTAVKIGRDDTNGYLTCGFGKGNYVVCESRRVLGSDKDKNCIDNVNDNSQIETCEDFNEVNGEGKVACYPKNHICNRYADDIKRSYYSIKREKLYPTSAVDNEQFYIYRKNIVRDDPNKNCNFDFPSCDLYLVNDGEDRGSKEYVNVVNKVLRKGEVRNTNNQKFIDIILGGFGNNSLFIYKGYCSLSGAECKNIMKSPVYFKYKVSNDNILYYTKNVNYSVCNNYLPNCNQLMVTSAPKTLYNNMNSSSSTKNDSTDDSGNNEGARNNFYKVENNIKALVREEHLWFANYRQFNGTVCLSTESTGSGNSYTINYDIGYCSDLDKNGELKYPNGLDTNRIHPNCYLKSCIDLTKDEIEKVLKGKSGKKYCSEYYWLSNKYGFKYFPQDKPTYCSDVSNSKLTFENGLNKRKDNCYLRACYSLSSDEREKVVAIKMTNLYNELNRMETETTDKITKCKKLYDCKKVDGNKDECTCKQNIDCNECDNFSKELNGSGISIDVFNPDNLYKYCENKVLINSRFSDNFDDINLNIIKCSDLKSRFGNSVTIAEKQIVDTHSIINGYNTTATNYICRKDYDFIVDKDNLEEKDGANIQSRSKGSFKNTILVVGEENGGKLENSKNYFATASDYYFKMEGNVMYYPSLKEYGISNYLNVCENVDNNILYYNTAVSKILVNGGFSVPNPIASADEDITDEQIKELMSSIDLEDISIEEKIATQLNKLKTEDKNKFLEDNVFECKNYMSKPNSSGIFIIDCGVYVDTGDDLGKEIISTPSDAGDENMSSIFSSLKNACRDKIEANKPVGGSVSLVVKSPRENIRNDEYNWLVKPTPVSWSNESRNIANNENLGLAIANSVEARGCSAFTNYYNDKVTESVEMRLASAIPYNHTNYISTTNFSDLAQKRKKGESCRDGEVGCINGVIVCDDSVNCKENCCKASDKIDFSDYTIEVAARFPENIDVDLTSSGTSTYAILNKIKCGFRSNNDLYKDVSVKVNAKFDGKHPEESRVKMLIGSDSDRFRSKIVKDKILVFRDSLVNGNSNSTATIDKLDFHKIAKEEGRLYYLETDIEYNSNDFGNKKNGARGYYEDTESDGLEDYLYALNGLQFITFDAKKYNEIHGLNKRGGYAFWTMVIPMPVICSLATAISGWIALIDGLDYDYLFFTCLSEPLFEMADDQVKRKRDQYLFYLNNSRNHVLDYFDNRKLPEGVKTDSGIILSANIIDNNNYLYNYYPRHEYIENDIRNKLESNIDRNGRRYYFNTVLSKDIIRACRLEKLVGDANNEEENKDEGIEKNDLIYGDSRDYKFTYYKLDKFGNRGGECSPKKDIKECLAEELVKCLESYDTAFMNHTESGDDIDDNFVRRNGKHLKKNNSKEGKTGKFVPVNVVAYTGNKFTNSQLMNRDECRIDENGDPVEGVDRYGNPIVDLSRCRGFEYKRLFYTENQAVPTPLFTHPFLFYKLITPKNVPELFDPTFILKQFCKFSDYAYEVGKPAYCKQLTNASEVRSITADFFNPKFVFSFDYTDEVGDSDLVNFFSFKNEYYAEITNENKKSLPYVVQYKSAADAKQNVDKEPKTFTYMLDKTYDIEGKGSYVPKICIYELATVTEKGNKDNGTCVSGFPDKTAICEMDSSSKNKLGTECIAKPGAGQCFIIVDNDVACYERNIPFFTNFIFKLDESSTFYNKPFINVYLKPDNLTYNDVISPENKENYIMRESDVDNIEAIDGSTNNAENTVADENSEKESAVSDDSYKSEDTKYISIGDRVASKAVNMKQGFGLNFERSYCSQAYYDYYTKVGELQSEQAKHEGRDDVKINKLKSQISSIEEFIIPDCNKENGEENEFLINESEIKTVKDTDVNGDKSKVIVKKTTIVKKYPESYGGFNEICVKDEDINNIFKYYNKQNTRQKSIPKVFAFRDKNKRGRKTKCLLDQISMSKKECLVADVVYVYCKDDEKSKNGCTLKLDVNTLKYSYIKPIDCLTLRDQLSTNGSINDKNIDEVEACYKGGFNHLGTVYKRIGDVREDPCSCAIADTTTSSSIDTDYFIVRDMTPREYGLCIDLVKPEFCPAVKYYDETNKYIDDNLVLGLTQAEILGKTKDQMAELKQTQINNLESINVNFRQHKWRTEEKMSGVLPSTFFTRGLGHAEFDSSIYCFGDDETKNEEFFKKNCMGGSRFVQGECKGFWKWSDESLNLKPTAVCKLQHFGNERVYEYELVGDSCQRYTCPAVGYIGNTKYTDEKELANNSSVAFSSDEMDFYENIAITDYRSYDNNEEQDASTVDKRGSSNGYATWKEVQSDDYATIEVGSGCFTGYAPVGSNYAIRSQMTNKNNRDLSFFDNRDTLTSKEGVAKFIKYVKNKKEYIDINILNAVSENSYPKRKCNQKGEWMMVEDVYNKEEIDKKILESNILEDKYYYDSANNFWVKTYLNKNNNNNGVYVSKYGGYCERLVCPAITIVERKNDKLYTEYEKDKREIYNEEINIKDISEASSGEYKIGEYNEKIYNTWNHSGGAEWDNVGAPRNSSNMISESGLNFNVSKNVNKIFTDPIEDGRVDSEFKYLKKVYGVCKTKYGFYNRGTKFTSTTFATQLSGLNGKQGEYVVDPRDTTFTTEDNGIKPERVCTSYGIWEGVVNRCSRACEMMDIYHTNINLDKLASSTGGDNYKNFDSKSIYRKATDGKITGGYYYIENDDIITVNRRSELEKTTKEEKFQALHLENPNGEKIGGFTTGDYLMGGAKWPRSAVGTDGYMIDNDPSSPKYRLRYIEVESECDKEYDTGAENTVRTYGRYEGRKAPKRRCYEDGSWGPVYNDTLCVLSKDCREFNFSLYDLKLMIDANKEGKTLREINEILANTITYNKDNKRSTTDEKCNDTDRDIGSCFIYKFTPNSTAGSAQSESELTVLTTNKKSNEDESDKEFGFANFESRDKTVYPLICNQSELDTGSSGKEQNVTGWSLKSNRIDEYFVPKYCREDEAGQFDSEIEKLVKSVGGLVNNGVIVNINETINSKPEDRKEQTMRYAKGTHLHYLYDFINGLNDHPEKRKYFLDNTSNKATSLEDESYKTVDFGNKKVYNSYQMHYVCNNNFTYNSMGDKDGKTTAYKNNHIVLECKGEKNSSGSANYLIRYHKDTSDYDNPGSSPMLGSKCYFKTCGGGNGYQHNWSKSIIKEAIDNFYNESNKKIEKIINLNDYAGTESAESRLVCPKVLRTTGQEDTKGECTINSNKCIESAFVITDSEIDSEKVEYFTDKNGNSYKNNGFVSALKTTCGFNYKNRTIINGTSCASGEGINKDLGSLDYQRYGVLDFNGIPKKFCQDIAKTRCGEENKDTAEEIIFGNKNFNRSFEDSSEGFCVPMGCRGTRLGIIKNGNGQITGVKEMTAAEWKDGKAGNFKLKEQYYGFGEYVIIQSADGDFTNSHNITKKAITDKMFINGSEGENKIKGSVCESVNGVTADPYTEGHAFEPFNIEKYCEKKGYKESSTSDDDSLTPYEKVYSCFNYLATSDSIANNKKNEDYKEVPNSNPKTYVNLTPSFSKLDKIANIYSNIEKYKPNDSLLKSNAVEFIVEKLIFNGVNLNTDYNLSSEQQIKINYFVEQAKIEAKKEAEKNFKDMSNTSGLYCHYDALDKNTELDEQSNNRFNKCIIKGPVSNNLPDSISSKINSYINNSGIEKLDEIFTCSNLTLAAIPTEDKKEDEKNCSGKVKISKTEAVKAIDQKYKIFCDEGYSLNEGGGTSGEGICEQTIQGVMANSELEGGAWSSNSECVSKTIFNNGELTGIDENGTKWKKGTEEEECQIKKTQNIKLDYDNYVCFYEIDESNSYKPADSNNNDNYQVNDNIGDKTINNDKYRSDSTKAITCANKNFVITTTSDISGYTIRDLEEYNKKYKEYYAKFIETIKKNLKGTATTEDKLEWMGEADKIETSDIWKSLYDEYYNIYKMEGYLNDNLDDFNLYTNMYEHFDEFQLMLVESGGRYYILTLFIDNSLINADEEVEEEVGGEENVAEEEVELFSGKVVVYDYFSKSSTRTKCIDVVQKNLDENDVLKTIIDGAKASTCSLAESEKKQINDAENDYYKEYYLKFLSDSKKKEIEELKIKNDDLKNFCYETYVDYLKKEKDYTDNSNKNITSTFRSGLYLGLQCTAEGWKVVDTPYCKERCSGTVDDGYQIKPPPLTTYKFKVKVENLRYGEKIATFVWGRARAAAHSGSGKNTRYTKAVINCSDNKKLVSDKETRNGKDGNGVVPEFDYWYKFPSKRYKGSCYREGILYTGNSQRIMCGSGTRKWESGDYICYCNGGIENFGGIRANIEVVDVRHGN